MTPEQMTVALGPEWHRDGPRFAREGALWGFVLRTGLAENRARIDCDDGEGRVCHVCDTAERAVAVALLLVAAERVAAGAAVAPQRAEFVDAYASTFVASGLPMVVHAIKTGTSPGVARRGAIHLLRAADAAEATR